MSLAIKKLLPLLLSIAFVSGCSSTASLSATKIKSSEQNDVESCQYVGDVHGSSGFGGVAASTGMENAKIEAKESAAKLGATHIVWMNISGGYSPSAFAKAYKC